LCRALMNQPDVLLMDEPTGNLDTGNADKIITYIQQICRDMNQTVLLTTHNPTVAKASHIHLNLENGTLRTIEDFNNR
ncbi:MAG: ABC transporter ATP-binding protein, partial [Fidelibacterota bacterium]